MCAVRLCISWAPRPVPASSLSLVCPVDCRSAVLPLSSVCPASLSHLLTAVLPPAMYHPGYPPLPPPACLPYLYPDHASYPGPLPPHTSEWECVRWCVCVCMVGAPPGFYLPEFFGDFLCYRGGGRRCLRRTCSLRSLLGKWKRIVAPLSPHLLHDDGSRKLEPEDCGEEMREGTIRATDTCNRWGETWIDKRRVRESCAFGIARWTRRRPAGSFPGTWPPVIAGSVLV